MQKLTSMALAGAIATSVFALCFYAAQEVLFVP